MTCICGTHNLASSRVRCVAIYDSEQEGAICLVALADLLDIDQNLPKFKTALPGTTTTDYPKISE